MAQTSFPFENVDTTEVQFSQWARHINEGIRPDFANELEVFADDSGLNVKVKSGQAMVRGHYYASTAEETLTITTPDATNPRIDSVVLELDIVANSILLKVVAGTPAASPVAPTLTQSEDGNVYQFLLGNVDVAAGVFSIEAGDVTDLRTYMFQGVGKWNTATRPENPTEYQTIGYNTDLNTHEVWNGSAWNSVFAPITTEGDLAIGDNTGTAVRLPIGAADTVLTSNGTTATWVEASGGGAMTLIKLPFEELAIKNVDFPSNSIVRFAIISTSNNTFNLSLLDSSNNIVSDVTVDRNNPFTYYTNATAIAKIRTFQNVINEEVQLVFSTPTSAQEPDLLRNIEIITTTQSVAISSTHNAFVFGGGGGGAGASKQGSSGGGGGSGYFTTGSLSAGTYTAAIGAGGAAGTNGGSSSIGGLSAAGGDGAIAQNDIKSQGGDGADGGSGGGAGAGDTNRVSGGSGGVDGDNGELAQTGTGAVGIGSSIQASTTLVNTFYPKPNQISQGQQAGQGGPFYGGGNGGGVYEGGFDGNSSTSFAGGGGGAAADRDSDTIKNGGSGFQGVILLVEA